MGGHVKGLHDPPRSDTIDSTDSKVTWPIQLEQARLVLNMLDVRDILPS